MQPSVAQLLLFYVSDFINIILSLVIDACSLLYLRVICCVAPCFILSRMGTWKDGELPNITGNILEYKFLFALQGPRPVFKIHVVL